MKKILITGGAGYIGSHTLLKFIEAGYEVAVFDSLENGHRESLDIIKEISESNFRFYQGDLKNPEDILHAVEDFEPEGIIHFAAYALVGESTSNPNKYYENNLYGGVNLLKALETKWVKKIVFSSTCAIFGQPEAEKISEDLPKSPINPYGKSKLMFEEVLKDADSAHGIKFVALRYFNAAGGDPLGRIGEDHDPETHLIPLILATVKGERDEIAIFGTDYDTPDGTCIRDYIHVFDLASAHIKAFEYLDNGQSDVFNLGTGNGSSVKEVIEKVKSITQKEFKVVERERRAGDPARLIADNAKAVKKLGWKPEYNIDQMIEHAWKWKSGKERFEY